MQQWLELATVLLFLTNLVMLGLSELGACIRMVAIQGILLGLFTLIVREDALSVRLIILGVVSMGLKGFVFPFLLSRDIREAKVRREVEPFVGYAASIVAGLLMLAVSMWIAARFPMLSTATSIIRDSRGSLDRLHGSLPRHQPAQSVNPGYRISCIRKRDLHVRHHRGRRDSLPR